MEYEVCKLTNITGKEDLFKTIEKKMGHKIVNTTAIKGGNRITKEHQKVSLANGCELLIKRCKLSQGQVNNLLVVNNYRLPQFQEIIGIYSIEKDDYYVIMNWKEGILLEDCNNKGFLNNLRAAAISLNDLHKNTKSQFKINIKKDDFIDAIQYKEYLTIEEKEIIIQYITANLHYLNNRHQSIIHGDLHLRNILVADSGIVFIDLDDVCLGDPFVDLVYAANLHYTDRETLKYYWFLQYYFNNKIPKEFWPVVNVYSIKKTMAIIEAEIQHSVNHQPIISMKSLLSEHDYMTQEEPRWYRTLVRQYR